MTEPATCEPPPAHRAVEWHWLKTRGANPEPMQWSNSDGVWRWGVSFFSPHEIHACGWRYVGPAVPPQEGA